MKSLIKNSEKKTKQITFLLILIFILLIAIILTNLSQKQTIKIAGKIIEIEDNQQIKQSLTTFDINKISISNPETNTIQLYQNQQNIPLTITNNNDLEICVKYSCDSELNHYYQNTESLITQCSPPQQSPKESCIKANSQTSIEILLEANPFSDKTSDEAEINIQLSRILISNTAVERNDALKTILLIIEINRG